MKYDDASWHYGGDFPAGLPDAAGATHIAMFLTWAALNGLASALHTEEFAEDLGRLRAPGVTPVAWFMAACDGKFTDEDLGDDGNAFARAYYGDANGLKSGTGSYLRDYESAFAAFDSIYRVPDDWATFALIEPIVQGRFDAWRAGG